MPQMAPMLWLVLFFYFVLLFLMFISNFYYVFSPASPSGNTETSVKTSSLNWLW
nr:ATP synthase F0 subunit 8 [Baetis sp. PC-2010]